MHDDAPSALLRRRRRALVAVSSLLPRRRRAAAALVAALATVAPAAAARADAPWTPPQDLSRAHTFVDDLSVGVGRDGTTLATWLWSDGIGERRADGVDGASLPASATAFEHERAISRVHDPVITPPILYGRTRALVATTRGRTVSAVFGRTDGSFGTPQAVATRAGLRGVRLAADDDGAAAIAWFEDRGVTDDRVVVSLRAPGGRFGAPATLAQERVRSVSVAVSPRGDVLVAWDARGVLRTRERHGGRWRRTETLSSEPAFFADLHTALTANGRAVVAWGAQFLSEGGDRGPVFYEAAVRPAGARGFRAAQLLEREPEERTRLPIALALDEDDPVVAWTGFDGAHARVRVAVGTPAFGAPRDVSPAGVDAFAGALAAGDGHRLVAWTESDPFSGGPLFAAVDGGAPELVSAGPEARVPAAAYNPSGKRFTLVWSNRPAGEARPVRTVAQSASRPVS